MALDQGGDAAQDAVGVQALDRLQGLDDAGLDTALACSSRAARSACTAGSNLDAEQVEDQAGDAGIVRQRLLLHAPG